MDPIITIKNIGKRYNITGRKGGYVALRDIFSEYVRHPYRSLKHIVKYILGKNRNEVFWALRDINFTVEKGEAIGIIGPNGAGKSTLLKILSRITPPTEGEIRIQGRVASLLEVGTGFHPELSGRENIYLNGAILGMTRKEIAGKIDQIIEFSGVSQFIDTPVKRYSSGMYVRLAFAIAAHIEPDILIVDEVLAVGDAEFQRKCLGKMDEVTRVGHRTVIFVSHNMDAISRLCTKTILLDKGKIIAAGDTDEVIGKYLSAGYNSATHLPFPIKDREVNLHSYSVQQDGNETLTIAGEKPFKVHVDFSIEKMLRSFRAGIFVKNIMGTVITRTFVQDYARELEEIAPGRYRAAIEIPPGLLMTGEYHLELKIFCLGITNFFEDEHIEKNITVYSPKNYNEVRSKNTDLRGYFLIPSKWETKKE
ncbi:MAG: ABC transporter ATP-binding protein [Patescibacteria group bacterium]